MTKQQLWLKVRDDVVKFWKFIVDNNPFTKQQFHMFAEYVRRSWKSIAVMFPIFLLLYYCIGGYVTNNIDKNLNFEFKQDNNKLAVIDAGAYLIKREVDENMWTPNLPFIFPGVVLDNMPSYQTGIMQTVRIWVKAMFEVNKTEELQRANELLKYPPNIWLLSKGDDLALAPSSGAQYRKAKKELLEFNKHTEEYDNLNLQSVEKILSLIENNLNEISNNLENQILEHSSDWVDFVADDIFYLNQGRIYAHYIMLKALSEDIKQLIIETKQYENLTSVFKAMKDAIAIHPSIIRNGQLRSVFTANHLMSLNYYISKAKYYLSVIKHDMREKNR
ncbi:MAG: DUF2333 family protein [Alphaproteobacteria bacterium]|nr:DUF2333 family protein [Alphaproteobacteria bacterium]